MTSFSGSPIGIDDIATYLPPSKIDNRDRAEALGFEKPFLEDKIGFTSLTMATEAETASDLAKNALTKLIEQGGVSADEIDCLVVCTQNPGPDRLPNIASVLHGAFSMQPSCAAFDISLGCSGYVYGLSVLKAFMAENGMTCGVLVTADPYSKIVAQDDRDTAVLFGDGATATVIRPGGRWTIGKGRFGSDGSGRAAISLQHGERLHMNGRRVFAFAISVVPDLLRGVAQDASTGIDQIDRFVVHQGSRFIVEELARRLEVGNERMAFGAQNTGNMVSSSIPALLEPALESDDAQIMIAGFGVGLSWAASILSKNTPA